MHTTPMARSIVCGENCNSMSLRECLDWPHAGCPRFTPGSRCAPRTAARKAQRRAELAPHARLVAEHRAAYGDWCPGYRRPPHRAADLTVDHIHPGDAASPRQVLCRACNSSKGSRR